MSPKTGRPKSDNPQNIRFEIRINKQTNEELQECAEKLQISRAEVIKRGITLVKKSLEKK